jgi:universal stress protein A
MDKSPFDQPEWRSMNQTPAVMRLRRILVPVDFGETTVEALRYAAAFAREYKATITLLHVAKPDGSEARRNLSSVSEDLVETGERQLRKLVDVIWGDEIATDIVVATGKPYLQIINEAKETGADMILMASHGPVGTWGLIRRGTATKVVRYAPCPVLVVRPFGRGFVRDAVAERCVDH